MAPVSAPHAISWRRIADWVEIKSGALAIVLCACFAMLSLTIAARRPFWYDEIVTVTIARAPTIKDLLANFYLVYDQTPPLNTLLVRTVCSFLGWTELPARLPSTIFLTAGLLLLFHQVRKLTSGLVGLAAIGVLLVTFLPAYAYEARPYALLFFASTLAIWFWTSAANVSTGSHNRSSVLFGLAMMLAMSAHYYAVLLLLPFAADELRSRGLRGVLSRRLVCGVTGISVAVALHLPFIRASSQMRRSRFWAIPSFHNLQEAYVTMLLGAIFALICAAVLMAWIGEKPAEGIRQQSPEERLGWFFLGIPAAGYIIGELVTHAFTERYFIPMLAGLGLASGCFLFRHYPKAPHPPLIILLITVPLFLETSSMRALHADSPAVSGRVAESDFLDEVLPQLRAEKSLILVLTRNVELEARYYATVPASIVATSPGSLSGLPLASGTLRIRYFSADEIRRHAREIAFIDPPPELLSNLAKWGFRLSWRRTKPEVVVYAE
jgi:hypothetical protein